MGVKFGGVDSSQIVQNEFSIQVLERIVEFLVNRNSSIIKPSQDELEAIQHQVVEQLKTKYPESGLELTKSQKV